MFMDHFSRTLRGAELSRTRRLDPGVCNDSVNSSQRSPTLFIHLPAVVAITFVAQLGRERLGIRLQSVKLLRSSARKTMMRTTQPLRLKSCDLSPGVGVRTGLSVADLRQSFLDNLFCSLGRVPMAATPNDIYTALALTVRDRVHKQGVRTIEARSEQEAR